MPPIDRLFCIIGMPRSGTTWLHHRLRRHDRMVCALGGIKEIHYFDTVHAAEIEPDLERRQELVARQRLRLKRFEMRIAQIESLLSERTGPAHEKLATQRQMFRDYVDRFAADDVWYAGAFEPGPADWCLDSTPAYHRLPVKGWRHLRATSRERRLILLLRDPFERAISGIGHRLARHGHDWDSWSETTRMDFCRFVVGTGHAVDAVRRLRSQFADDELRIMLFDRILDDPRAVVRECLDFAELVFDPKCMADGETAPNPSPKVALAQPCLNLIHAETRATVDGFAEAGVDVPAAWFRGLGDRRSPHDHQAV